MDGELKMVELEAVLYCLNITESSFHAVMLKDFISQYHTNKLRSH
jgi:hypothetical protein